MEIDRVLRVAVPTSSAFKQVCVDSVVSAIIFYNNTHYVTTLISQYVFAIAISFRRGGMHGAGSSPRPEARSSKCNLSVADAQTIERLHALVRSLEYNRSSWHDAERSVFSDAYAYVAAEFAVPARDRLA